MSMNLKDRIPKLPKEKKIKDLLCVNDDPQFKIFYRYNSKDTAPVWHIKEILSMLRSSIEPFYPEEFFDKFKIEIWNHHRPDCQKEDYTFNKRTGKSIVTTAYLDELNPDRDWNYILSYCLGEYIAWKIKFLKPGSILKEWKRIRGLEEVKDKRVLKETFIEDFVEFYNPNLGQRVYHNKRNQAANIQGLKHFILLWDKFKKYIDLKELIIHRKFIYNLNKGFDYAGLFYTTYYPNRKEKQLFVKLDIYGYWSYNFYTDEWIKFRSIVK